MTQPLNHTDPESVPQPVTQSRKRSVVREYVEAILIAVLLALLIRTFVVQAFKIPSGSMIPTLLVGDHILVNKFIYRFRDPARGDVVVFKYPVEEHRDFIKRVIAVGGEEIYIKDRQVFINCQPPAPTCQPIKESWAYYEDRMAPGGEPYGPKQVPAGHHFVMGDNRNNSQDSRWWGYVKQEKIKGQAFIIYWSWDSEHDRKPLWQRVRWGRLGRLIH
ncbi:MAG: signal peptidase I [Candidatus Rokuibacteriota bacterium]